MKDFFQLVYLFQSFTRVKINGEGKYSELEFSLFENEGYCPFQSSELLKHVYDKIEKTEPLRCRSEHLSVYLSLARFSLSIF